MTLSTVTPLLGRRMYKWSYLNQFDTETIETWYAQSSKDGIPTDLI